MQVLLDTHAFLWAATEPERLGAACRARLLDPDSELLLSLASVWEMAIKASLGKLRFEHSLEHLLDEGLRLLGFRLLAIELDHVLATRALPFHHRDPFDRLLVAQALALGCPLLGRDRVFDEYGVERIW